jgi:hypothetical protein
MTNSIREILEGTQRQGTTEEVTYTLTYPASWGTPTSPTVKVYSVNETTSALTDVTSTVMPSGSASADGQVVTLPELKSLTADVLYRVVVTVASGTNVFTAKADVRAEL